jgi:(S)-mandelate dehydrogenase
MRGRCVDDAVLSTAGLPVDYSSGVAGVVSLNRIATVADMERAAHRALPRQVFDVIAGGADDELVLLRNRAALTGLRLRPHVLRDVSSRDLSVTLFGETYSLPVMLAPVGYQRLVHRDGEVASVRAASSKRVGTLLSGGSSCSPEAVAAAVEDTPWYQLYPSAERQATQRILSRIERLGYPVLCVTVDTPMHAVRSRDIRNRITMPLRPTPSLVASALRHPRWTASLMTGGAGRGLPASTRFPADTAAARHVTRGRVGRVISSDDLAWIRDQWSGPMIVKGVLNPQDVDHILGHGVDGIVVSNHGGRQFDYAPSTIEVLPEIVAAVSGRVPVLIDSGFRRGAEVVAALALGASAVLIGRPYIYGLAVAGRRGVEHVLEILAAEIDTALGLVGAASLKDLEPSLVQVSTPA